MQILIDVKIMMFNNNTYIVLYSINESITRLMIDNTRNQCRGDIQKFIL